jgi:hypothetical protein
MSEQNKKSKYDICPSYSEIDYINTDPIPGFKNCRVESVQGRCSKTKKDCCCMGNLKFCEKNKNNKINQGE